MTHRKTLYWDFHLAPKRLLTYTHPCRHAMFLPGSSSQSLPRGCRRILKPMIVASTTHFSDTFPSPGWIGTGICFDRNFRFGLSVRISQYSFYARRKQLLNGAAPKKAAGFRWFVLAPQMRLVFLPRNRFLRHYANLPHSAIDFVTAIAVANPMALGAPQSAAACPPNRRRCGCPSANYNQ